ncbi:IS1096 element passenger TnpR family protein [Desulfosporosinus fructosivorans]
MKKLNETLTTLAFMQEVLKSYNITVSLQKTADELEISYAKVRKILITLGEYTTDFSLEVGKRRSMGKSIFEIATELNTSTNRVTAFLPYEKNLYTGPEPTTDAKKSKVYRKKIKIAREKFVNRAINNDEKRNLSIRREKFMRNDCYSNTNAFKAVHFHLELKNDHLDDAEKAILRKYGESSTGDSISRNILIPSDMPLHNLHYAIQRLFGWQNSHLRRFVLPEEIYDRLTDGTVKGWTDLVGILFQPPGECEHDVFWDDDYQSGSIKTWLKKKYTGPYFFHGITEDYEWAQNDIKQLIERFPILEVQESFSDYMSRSKGRDKTKPQITKKAPLIELTLEEMNNSIIMEGGTESLLERLEVATVLAFKDEDVCNDNGIFPVTHKLIYNYDFGDDWTITITKEKDCRELLQKGYISKDELLDAEATVLTKHKPVCIHKDGVFVLDDVGGLHGFISFLKEIYEGEDKEERSNYKAWAQSLGWSQRKISNKLIL